MLVIYFRPIRYHVGAYWSKLEILTYKSPCRSFAKESQQKYAAFEICNVSAQSKRWVILWNLDGVVDDRRP